MTHNPDRPTHESSRAAYLTKLEDSHERLLAACKALYSLMPVGHANDNAGMWAEAGSALLLAAELRKERGE